MPLLPQQSAYATRPHTAAPSSTDSLKKSTQRLTEYQQFFPGTPAFAEPVDGDVNQAIYDFVAPRCSPKLPSMHSMTSYSEYFKRPSSRESQVQTQYPFESSKIYKRTSATPKSHSHEHHRLPKNSAYARGKKCDPCGHLTTGNTCDFWASSYQIAHARGKQRKHAASKEKRNRNSDDVDAFSEVPAARDFSPFMWWSSSYQLAFPTPTPSQSEASLRASTAPGRSRQQNGTASKARLPSVPAFSNAERGEGAHLKRFSSTPNLPVV